MTRSVDLSRPDLIEYLANTPSAWQPQDETDHDADHSDESASNRLARLDAALLALIDPLDCESADLPIVLDRALQQSL